MDVVDESVRSLDGQGFAYHAAPSPLSIFENPFRLLLGEGRALSSSLNFSNVCLRLSIFFSFCFSGNREKEIDFDALFQEIEKIVEIRVTSLMFSNVSLSLSFRRLDRGAFLKAREIGRPRIKLAETREIKYRGPRSWRRSCEPLAVVNSTALSRYSYTRKCSEGWLSHFSHANSEPAIVVVSPFKIYCFVETVPCPPPLSLNTAALLSSPSDARGSRRNGSIFRSLHRNCLLNLFPYISLNFHACKIYEITSTVVAIIFLLLILQCRILCTYIHVHIDRNSSRGFD